MLLNRIEKEVEYVEKISSEIEENSLKGMSLDKITFIDVPLLSKWKSLARDKNIRYVSKGSKTKEVLKIIRNFMMNKELHFNKSLLSLIDLRVKSKNNLTDPLIYSSDINEITVNIDSSFTNSPHSIEWIFSFEFMKKYIKQLNDISGLNIFEDAVNLIRKFVYDAKLYKWGREFTWDEEARSVLCEFFGYSENDKNWLVRIITLGMMSKYKNSRKTPIEIASIKLLDHIEAKYLISIYENVI